MATSETPATGVPQLELSAITKRYPGVLANDGIDLKVMPGEIHALLGENGAGKSTLVKIIYGVVRADAGEVKWAGRSVRIQSPGEARALGIGMVFQHFNLFETLTVAENVSLGLDTDHDIKKLIEEIRDISERYGLPINPHQHIHSLSVGERQRVEIVRCLVQNPRMLIMDEPTSVLTPQEVNKLFQTLRRLASEKCGILYISHKLDEIQELCDTATVLRGGRVTATCDPRQETPHTLAKMMIGSDLPVCHRTEPLASDQICLDVRGLSLASPDPHGTDLKNVTFSVLKGEIFGIAGVAGNGQKELLAAINGERISPVADAIRIEGKPVADLQPGERRELGLAFVPEERLGRGAAPEMSLAQNALLTAYGSGLLNRDFIRFEAVRDYALEVRDRFDVKCSGVDAEAKSLSGGNLQKFIVGREVMIKPTLLVLGYPTWGVDVGAATTIRQAIVDLAQGETALVVVSEDLDELFEICDRVAVMAEGRLSPARATAETSVEEDGRWMGGQFEDGGKEATRAS